MKVGDNINVVMDDRLPRTLTLDEFIPYDPSCYSYEAGFFAFDADDVSFFISAESGVVYGQREPEQGKLDAWDVPVGRARFTLVGEAV